MIQLGTGLRKLDERSIDARSGLSPKRKVTSAASPQLAIPEDSERGGLFEILRVVRAEYKSVLVAMGIGLALALMVALIKQPMYTASCELVIESPNGDFLGGQALNPVAVNPSDVSGLTDVQTQLQIIQSDQMIDRVIAKLNSEGKLHPLEKEASGPLLFARFTTTSPQERTYRIHKLFAKHLSVRQVGPTRAVDVSFSSTDPGFSADVCNTLAAEYVAYNTEARWALSEKTGEGLSHRLDAVRAHLSESQKTLQDYAEKSGLLFGPSAPAGEPGTDISENRLTQLQDELSHADADRMAAESRFRTAQASNAGSIAEALNDDSLRDLQAKISDLQRQKAELETVYTPQHEKVVRVQAQLASLQSAFSRRQAEILERIRTDYNGALRREDLLKSAYNNQVGIVTNKNSKAIQYGIYKQQVDSDQKLYESMLEQVNRAGIASAASTSNVQVFSSAHPPARPDSSGIIMYSAAGLFFGFLAGSALAVTRAASNRTFHAPGQSATQVNLREIGVIPRCSLSSLKSASSTKGSSVLSLLDNYGRDGTSKSRRVIGSSRASQVELACFLDKSGVVAESFRMLLASIMFADAAEKRPQVIVFTSANPREGKTTVLCNLAIAMSEIRQRVLMIDGDLRRPRLHDVFGLPNDRGLRNILESTTDENPFEDLVQKAFLPRIDILPSGTAEGNSEASLFYSSQLTNLMQTMRKSYDVILIDTPPCLHLADARVIGRTADAAILVTRTGYTTWDEGRAVAQQFSEDGTRILGTVLNDFKKSITAYSYLSE